MELNCIPIVSDRKHFKDADHISIETNYKTVNLSTHAASALSLQELLSQVSNKTTLLLIHGYNCPYEKVLENYFNSYNLAFSQYDQIIGYLWPGGDEGIEYHAARCRTVCELDIRLLGLIAQLHAVTDRIDIFAHSMGCRLALEMLDLSPGKVIRNLFLAAPAVDNEALEEGERYFKAAHQCEHITVFHSKNDKVLKAIYFLGDFDRALGYRGAENPEKVPSHVTFINSSHEVFGHEEYDESQFVFDEIARKAQASAAGEPALN